VAILAFPPIKTANEHGLLARGGDLEPESLLLAYRSGIFPWPVTEDGELLWFAPPKRAVLNLKDFQLSRSMQRVLSKSEFKFAVNKNCFEVITACQSIVNRPSQHGTWITDEMKAAYLELNRLGFVHSLECYRGEELVGGVYGVCIGQAFAAESMFYRYPNASKAALWILGQYLQAQGATWIDCQIINPHLSSLGVIEISRDEFIKKHLAMVAKTKIEFSSECLNSLLSSMETSKKLR